MCRSSSACRRGSRGRRGLWWERELSENDRGFGARLRACRQSAGLSQEGLAERSGLSIRAISNLERGATHWPYRNTLNRLADALELHGAARTEFMDAPGHRPGHRAVADARQRRPRVRARGPVPRQLPTVAHPFVGRAHELAALDELLRAMDVEPRRVSVITAIMGTAGIGKTTLALHWAHIAASRFPDGQLYANLRGYDPSGGPAGAAEIIPGFLRAMRVDQNRIPVSVDEQAGMYRSLLAGKRMLLVLDNALDAAQVRPLLPGSSGCLVLVTSRGQLSGLVAFDGALRLSLDVLSQEEASDLFTARLGPDRAGSEPRAIEEMSRLCGHLPLALSIAAARAAAFPEIPLSALASELRDTRNPLDGLNSGEPGVGVRDVFSWSYQRLDSQVSRMFRLLSSHPSSVISVPAASSLADYPVTESHAALRDLVRTGLITENTPGRYKFHDLVRAYSSERSEFTETATEHNEATRRMLDHYLYRACAADETRYHSRWPITFAKPAAGTILEEFISKEQAYAWLDLERLVLLKLVELAADSGFEEHSWQLAWTIRNFLNDSGYHQMLLTILRTALHAACRIGDQTGQAYMHLGLGRACTELRDFQEAKKNLEQAMGLYREIGQYSGEAYVALAISMALQEEGRYDEAIAHVQQAIGLCEVFSGDPGIEFIRLRSVNNIVWLHACAGSFNQARSRAEEALKVFRRVSRPDLAANVFDSLGFIHNRLGEHAEAIACFRQALDLIDPGNGYAAADSLEHLADACRGIGDHANARAALHDALAALGEPHHPRAARIRDKLRDLRTTPRAPYRSSTS